MYNLALLYYSQEKRSLSRKYFKMASDLGDPFSMGNLGLLYFRQKRYNSAEKYYLMSYEIIKNEYAKDIKENHAILKFYLETLLENMILLYDKQNKKELSNKYSKILKELK